MAYLAAVNWPALILFSALVLSVSMYGLSFSGHFPAEQRPAELQGPAGQAILGGTGVAVAICAFLTLRLAWLAVPVPLAIIGAGGALLAAPLVLQMFPDRFVDGRSGLMVLAGVSAVLVVAARWFVA